jgi:hypothetical protein
LNLFSNFSIAIYNLLSPHRRLLAKPQNQTSTATRLSRGIRKVVVATFLNHGSRKFEFNEICKNTHV